MKRFSVLILFWLLAGPLMAQQYQCLQPGEKVYFTNAYHYLRGIRIDSVQAAGTNTIFYPYHTPRGAYPLAHPLDTTGGSWLGKKVMQLPDGTTLFDNLWRDTIVVKTQALTGQQWIFYNDTSAIYYRATAMSVDTMTVSGTVDSVKRIRIEAMQGSAVLPGDPAHGNTILLSKNHGFVQVFDLYTFPYHEPGKVYQRGFDYFLDVVTMQLPDTPSSTFVRTDYTPPAYKELYDASPGDIFQYEVRTGAGVVGTLTDTIVFRQTVGTQVNYSYKYGSIRYHPGPTVPYFSYDYGTGSFGVPAGYFMLIDTVLMPEEWGSRMFYYYDPRDTVFCYTGSVYGASDNNLVGNIVNIFEPCGFNMKYKAGIGLIDSARCINPLPGDGIEYTLSYLKRNGAPCGHLNNLAVSGIAVTGFRLFPNPADDKLYLQAEAGPTTAPIRISLYNPAGALITSQNAEAGRIVLDVASLPAGLYFVGVSDGLREIFRKVIIWH